MKVKYKKLWFQVKMWRCCCQIEHCLGNKVEAVYKTKLKIGLKFNTKIKKCLFFNNFTLGLPGLLDKQYIKCAPVAHHYKKLVDKCATKHICFFNFFLFFSTWSRRHWYNKTFETSFKCMCCLKMLFIIIFY